MKKKLTFIALFLLPIAAMSQTTITGIINDTKVFYDARTAGVKADGVTNDLPALNSAITTAVASGYGAVQLPCGQILVQAYPAGAPTHFAINATNTPNLTISGCQNNQQFGLPAANMTQILCETGSVCLDMVGSGRFKLKDINLTISNSYPTPSTVAIMMGRDNANPPPPPQLSPFCFSEFNRFDNVWIFTDFNNTINAGRGYIGIYNIAAELFSMHDVSVVANTPFFFASTNVLGLSSPDQPTFGQCPQSMREVTFDNVSGRALSANVLELWNGGEFNFNNFEADFGNSDNQFAVSLQGSNGVDQVRGSLHVEFPTAPGGVLAIGTNVDHLNLDMNVGGMNPAPSSYIQFTQNNLTVTNSSVRVRTETTGAWTMFSNIGAGEVWRQGEIDLGTSLAPLNASHLTLFGTVVHADGFTDSQVTFAPGSNYVLLDNSGISVVGNFAVNGILSKAGGAFKIDHPLDPERKYLQHSFVESPDMMNVYNGIVTLDGAGKAKVQLPDYFEALNRDFRYQLTPLGTYAPIYVSQRIKGNIFHIGGGKPGMEVSWQITGIRHDPYANTHRILVEEEK